MFFWNSLAFSMIQQTMENSSRDRNIIPPYCLLRNLYAGQEATDRTGQGTMYWFHIGKGVHQGCILSSCLFNLYAEYIMRNAGLDEAQAKMQMIPPLWQKVKNN